jgi:hypothetical protein
MEKVYRNVKTKMSEDGQIFRQGNCAFDTGSFHTIQAQVQSTSNELPDFMCHTKHARNAKGKEDTRKTLFCGYREGQPSGERGLERSERGGGYCFVALENEENVQLLEKKPFGYKGHHIYYYFWQISCPDLHIILL